jgi:tetratricopeptide (TPR) repeat protein
MALWQRSPVHPLGLSLRNIVLADEAGQQLPWLVPCPAVVMSTPCDLFGLDATVIAALAPETIRGVMLNERAQDMYALGTLVAQAAGCPQARSARDDESRVETQARGALLVSTGAGSMVDPIVLTTPPMDQLFRAIRHYRHAATEARPHDAAELQSALAAATDPIALAEVFRSTDPVRALQMLSLADRSDPALHLHAMCLAADIYDQTGDRQAALRCLDVAVSLDLDLERIDLRRQRCDMRWQVLLAAAGEAADEEIESLLNDIKVLKALDASAGTMWYLRAAEVYRRKGDLGRAAGELYDAIEVDPTDLQALLLYAQCWIDLKDTGNAAQVVGMARRRISGMVGAGLITRTEGQRWNDEFDHLPG